MAKLVLIVEDSETCAETLLLALETLPGVELRMFRDPREAAALMSDPRREVAAVITDLHFTEPAGAGMDGFDLIRNLRADPRFARVPVLMVSAAGDSLLPQRALAGGADAFFPKPYSPSAVRRKLEELLC